MVGIVRYPIGKLTKNITSIARSTEIGCIPILSVYHLRAEIQALNQLEEIAVGSTLGQTQEKETEATIHTKAYQTDTSYYLGPRSPRFVTALFITNIDEFKILFIIFYKNYIAFFPFVAWAGCIRTFDFFCMRKSWI
jgi:hypothetical protein